MSKNWDIPTESQQDKGIVGTDTDIHGGVGSIKHLVDIGTFVDESGLSLGETNLHRGEKCNYCGWERARFETHTEIDSWFFECDNCGAALEEGGSQ